MEIHKRRPGMHLIIMLGIGFLSLFSQCDMAGELEEEVEKEIGPEGVISTTAFYVAPPTATPAGDDRNPGTYDKPWATWEKAFNSSEVMPGDTVYFRGGVYYHTQVEGGYGYDLSRNGVEGRYVHYLNYPQEKPVLDCSRIIPERTINIPVTMRNIQYVHFKGLTIRNVWQSKGEDEVIAWIINGSNVIVENCTVHDTHGIAFKSNESTELYYINCDAYNNCDSLTTVPASNPMPGNDGTGFQDFNWNRTDAKVYYKDCRAWNCGDQGFSSGSVGYTEYEGCWSFANGQLEGDGHGFKMGWIENVSPNVLHRLYKNCLAVHNRQNGFTTNDVGYECGSLNLFNNTAYHNGYDTETGNTGYGFYIDNTNDSDERERLRILKNNISYQNNAGHVRLGSGAQYTHIHNSWDNPPGVTVTSGDFLSLDSTGLSAPRKMDGGLPKTDFLRLAPGSKLVDKGTATTGLPFKGSAPDLGAYELEN
jgi:signal peptidase I